MEDYTADMAKAEAYEAYKTSLTKRDRRKIDKAIKRTAKQGLFKITVRLTNRLKKSDLITVYQHLGYVVSCKDRSEWVEISWQ